MGRRDVVEFSVQRYNQRVFVISHHVPKELPVVGVHVGWFQCPVFFFRPENRLARHSPLDSLAQPHQHPGSSGATDSHGLLNPVDNGRGVEEKNDKKGDDIL